MLPNISALPKISVSRHSQMPQIPAVYLVIDGNGVVQYVGQSIGIQSRFRQHHRIRQFLAMPDAFIAWIPCAPDSLSSLEKKLIISLRPRLNGTTESKRAAFRAIAYKHGETKKPNNLMLTVTSTNLLDSLAEQYDTSRSEVLERVLRHPDFAKFVADAFAYQHPLLADTQEQP